VKDDTCHAPNFGVCCILDKQLINNKTIMV
jgi:hypothetical protein